MRSLETIQKEIKETRERLHELYVEKQEAASQDINIDKTKLYKFHDADDPDIKYIGKVYDYFMDSDGEYIFNITGVQHSFSEYRDSCWSSFDAKYALYIQPDKLDEFLKGFEEISEEEFANSILEWQFETSKQLMYWLKQD